MDKMHKKGYTDFLWGNPLRKLLGLKMIKTTVDIRIKMQRKELKIDKHTFSQ